VTRSLLATAVALSLAPSAAAAQDDYAALQKRVQETARKLTDAFVFLGGGSGVLISADGWFLTNHHVIAGLGGKAPDKTRITLADGKGYSAKMVCTDAVGDIALLKIETEEAREFNHVEFGDSDKLECGQYVIAVGNPFNLAGPTANRRWYPSVSLGIVSALHRYQQQYSDCIQTDAAVNPGNSGGPLVTLDGKLIGINGRIATRYGNRVNSGVGYAIPSNQIKNFLEEMKRGGIDGKIYHGMVKGLDIAGSHQDGRGALVSGVRQSSPAARAGFKEGDLIVGVNQYAITSGYRFLGVVGTYPMEREIAIKVKRGEESVEIKVRLDRSEGVDIMGRPTRPGGAYLGVILEDKADGAEVTHVAPDSPAEKAGLQLADLIVKVDGAKVLTRETILERVRLRKSGDHLKLTVKRGDEELELDVTLGKKD